MNYLLIEDLRAYNAKNELTVFETAITGVVDIADIQLRDSVSIKYKLKGKSYWSFRDDFVKAIKGDRGVDADATIPYPGMTVYSYRDQSEQLVIRKLDNSFIVEDMTEYDVLSLEYLTVKRSLMRVPREHQRMAKGCVAYHRSKIVNDEDIPKLIEYLKPFKTLAFDSETTGLLQEIYKLDNREDFVTAISISTDANSGFYIRNTKSSNFKLLLKTLCEQHDLLVHNASFDVGMLSAVYGLVPQRFDDTLVMAKLLNENLFSYGLKNLADSISGKGKQLKLNDFNYLNYLKLGHFDRIEQLLAYYACADTANTFLLYEYMYPKLSADTELYNYYRDIEIASIVPVSIAINQNGLKVDKEQLTKLSSEVTEYSTELLKEMVELTKPYFDKMNVEYHKEQDRVKRVYADEVIANFKLNLVIKTDAEEAVTRGLIMACAYDILPAATNIKKLSSYHNKFANKFCGYRDYYLDLSNRKVMGLLLYEHIHGFELPKQVSASGQMSVGKNALNELDKYLVDKKSERATHAKKFIELLRAYTKNTKLDNAFIKPTLSELDLFKDGKLHASYNLLGTVSSRASCNNPNFQQLANNKKFDLRKCFITDKQDYSFLQFDYEAQELRVMAALSRDPLLMELIKAGKDLHSETVRRVWPETADLSDDDIKEKHKDKRDTAKVILFSLAYGAGTKKIAFITGRSIPDAARILEAFKANAYPTLIQWLEDSKQEVVKNKGATLVGGYKRHYKPTGNTWSDEAELRSIVNSLIQGTSAYITKVATLRILDNLKKAGISHNLVILIHDSITIQVKDSDVSAAWKIMEDSMYYDLDGIPVEAVGAVNKDMSKNTERKLDEFLEALVDDEDDI